MELWSEEMLRTGEYFGAERRAEASGRKLEVWCPGPPLVSRWGGKEKLLQDGLGRCSPGRWPPGLRGLRLGSRASQLAEGMNSLIRGFCEEKIPELARWSFALALGRFQERPFKEEELQGHPNQRLSHETQPPHKFLKTPHVDQVTVSLIDLYLLQYPIRAPRRNANAK